jgi:hypothetical protein
VYRTAGLWAILALGLSERFNMFNKALDVVHILPTSSEGHFFHFTFIVRLISQQSPSFTLRL